MIARNTIGSPVADHRNGPYGSFGVTGPSSRPPFGRGSLGIAVADVSTSKVPPSEKAYFGNEVDFYGDPVLGLHQVGFHVFQTGENVTNGGPRNMPNINFEIDPNLTTNPSNYTSMVWIPPASPAVNQWSGYLDAATTGEWYFTGSVGVTTGCNQVTTCTFTQAKTRSERRATGADHLHGCDQQGSRLPVGRRGRRPPHQLGHLRLRARRSLRAPRRRR